MNFAYMGQSCYNKLNIFSIYIGGTYETTKTGRKVTTIKFYITSNISKDKISVTKELKE
jgi:plasmid replication initiation protein